MSFWSWMKENYPKRFIEWFKRRNLNFAMYFIGILGCCVAFPTSVGFFLMGYPENGLIYLGLAGTGFILGNYGWYRHFG